MSIENQDSSKEVWAGLIGVKQKPGSDFFEGGIKGAYVNILAWASTADEYSLKIEEALKYYGLYLFSAENIKPLSVWITNNPDIDKNLLKLAEEVKKTGNARFGTYHEYKEENREDDREGSGVRSILLT